MQVDVHKVGGGLAKVDDWISEVEEVFGRSPGSIKRREMIADKLLRDGESMWGDESELAQHDDDDDEIDPNSPIRQRSPQFRALSLDDDAADEDEEEGEDKGREWGGGGAANGGVAGDESEDDRRIRMMVGYQDACAKWGKSPIPHVCAALLSGWHS